MIKFLKGLFKSSTYQSEIESYIISNSPTSIYDVERLTREFDKRFIKGSF